MFELCKRGAVAGADLLNPLQVYGRPTAMPRVAAGHSVVCGYDQGLGERLIVCGDLADMQELYDGYAAGGALTIKWYSGHDVDFVSVVPSTTPES